jgi:hypothetical protein
MMLIRAPAEMILTQNRRNTAAAHDPALAARLQCCHILLRPPAIETAFTHA